MRTINSLNIAVRHVCAVLTIYFLNNILYFKMFLRYFAATN